MNRRGKQVALWSVAVGAVVLVGAGFAAKNRVREEWLIYVLRTGDDDSKKDAAEELGEMRSVHAVKQLEAELGQWIGTNDPVFISGQWSPQSVAITIALYRIRGDWPDVPRSLCLRAELRLLTLAAK